MYSKSGVQHGSTVICGYPVDGKPRIARDELAVTFAINPLPLKEYLGEVSIIHKGDKPKVNHKFKANRLSRSSPRSTSEVFNAKSENHRMAG